MPVFLFYLLLPHVKRAAMSRIPMPGSLAESIQGNNAVKPSPAPSMSDAEAPPAPQPQPDPNRMPNHAPGAQSAPNQSNSSATDIAPKKETGDDKPATQSPSNSVPGLDDNKPSPRPIRINYGYVYAGTYGAETGTNSFLPRTLNPQNRQSQDLM